MRTHITKSLTGQKTTKTKKNKNNVFFRKNAKILKIDLCRRKGTLS